MHREGVVAILLARDEAILEPRQQAPSGGRDGPQGDAVDLFFAAKGRGLEEQLSFFWVDIHIDPRKVSISLESRAAARRWRCRRSGLRHRRGRRASIRELKCLVSR